jgi:hypothetical protein
MQSNPRVDSRPQGISTSSIRSDVARVTLVGRLGDLGEDGNSVLRVSPAALSVVIFGRQYRLVFDLEAI